LDRNLALLYNIILHIPHSSAVIPFTEGYILDESELKEEINLLTDWHTEKLFDLPYRKIVAPFSRIFCDVERFTDDNLEVMSKYGMGVCYTHTDLRKLMREVTPELMERILKQFYYPHHKRFEDSVREVLSRNESVLIIDCHSFTEKPLMRDLNKDLPRPDFCLGTDDFHTPASLLQKAYDYISKHGYTVKVNEPYAGTIVPLKYYRKNARVLSLMIEINRRLYISNDMEEVKGKLSILNGFIEKLVSAIN